MGTGSQQWRIYIKITERKSYKYLGVLESDGVLTIKMKRKIKEVNKVKTN